MTNKHLGSLILFTLICFAATAQVKFRDIAIDEALKLAGAENKIVFVYVASAECGQCNDVADQGFANTTYGLAMNNSCISLKVKPGSSNFKALDSMFRIGNAFGQLFIDKDGDLLHRHAGSSSAAFSNMQQLEKAMDRKEKPDLAYKELQKAYAAGARDFNQLYALVAKKTELQLEHDQLTEEMLDLAPADSAKSASFLKFVAEQVPVIDSKADKYMRKDARLFNEAWYLMPLNKRIALNMVMIAKSKAKAVKDKDRKYAIRVASFTAATYSDRIEARKSFDKALLDFYSETKDTTSFLLNAVKYYDQYLMSINVDSMKKADTDRQMEMANAAMPGKDARGTGPVQTSVQYAPAAQYFTGELNNGAWTVYIFTHDASYNKKALDWAKRANEFFDQPDALDTYARLLYRTGSRPEGIDSMEKALRIAKLQRRSTKDLEEVLARMKTGADSIDKY